MRAGSGSGGTAIWRAKSNLSRTLKTMEGYGLVRMEKRPNRALAPRVTLDDIRLDLPLRSQSA